MTIQLKPIARRTVTLTIVGILVAIALPTEPIAAQSSIEASSPLTIPKRRPVEGAPTTPPALPASADSVAAATLDFVVTRKAAGARASNLRHTVSRTVDRMHLTASDRREWLFERNPVDPRRVSATLVEHAGKAVIVYGETDLRMALGIRGWADVLAFGFDSEMLGGYKKTAEVRTLAGIRFARYVATPKPEAGAGTDVWWSHEQALPSQFAITDGGVSTRFTLERVRPGTDPKVLQPAQSRFPGYRVVDYADWLEKH